MTKSTLLAALLCVSSSALFAQSVALNQSHLSALDGNVDGAISSDEFFAFATFAFNKMDKNNDALLSADEVDEHLVAESFAQLDKDGDGGVSPDEFALQMDADFKEADKDGDGILN
jgi:Ca2+-binding EF-hand superfamily protein